MQNHENTWKLRRNMEKAFSCLETRPNKPAVLWYLSPEFHVWWALFLPLFIEEFVSWNPMSGQAATKCQQIHRTGNYSNFSGSMGTMFGTMDAGWFSSNPLVDINPRSNCYRDKHDKPNKNRSWRPHIAPVISMGKKTLESRYVPSCFRSSIHIVWPSWFDTGRVSWSCERRGIAKSLDSNEARAARVHRGINLTFLEVVGRGAWTRWTCFAVMSCGAYIYLMI